MKLQIFILRKSSVFVFILSLALGFFLASCDSDDNGGVGSTRYSASEDFSYQIEVANRTHLQVNAINGSVEVTGISNTDSVRIWGERKVKSESVADAEEHLQYLSVHVDTYDDEIVARTEQPSETGGRDYEVTYYVLLPDDWKVSIEEANGSVSVSAIHDSVDVGLSNGEVVVDSIYGDVNISLANGSIDGKVFLPIHGTCAMSVANGEINLSIPDTTSAEFSASVSNGEVSVSNLVLSDMISTSTSVTGTLGDGEGQIDLSVANGTIIVAGF